MSGRLEQLQLLIDRVVFEAARVGLGINVGKTAVVSVGVGAVTNPVLLVYGLELKVVTDFCLLGSWMRSTARDVGTRRALTWRAAASLTRIWKLSIVNWLKRRLFHALVEPVLTYGCEAWTLTAALNKRLDGTYTRLLRFCQRSSWRDHMMNAKLYAGTPKISETIRRRRLEFVGHCARSDQPIAHALFYGTCLPGRRGRPRLTYVKQRVESDMALSVDELNHKRRHVTYSVLYSAEAERKKHKADWDAVIAQRCS